MARLFRIPVGAACALLVAGAVVPTSPALADNAKSGHAKPGRAQDSGTRRGIAGGPTTDDLSLGAETPELRALREAERELFPPASPAPGHPWPEELSPVPWPHSPPASAAAAGTPEVHASGLPPSAPTRTAPVASESGKDLTWLAKLQMPDIPVRWDDRVVRYLEFFRDDPRGHGMFANLYRHSGRYREMIQRALRRKSLPEDLVWVAMVESGFDPSAKSVAAAVGLWQFTVQTAKIYGLVVDRWLDQRMDVQVETDAAADHLGDLHRRFGSWEMALAAYDMGYGGLSVVVRRYNTNDFWSLSHTEGTLPWETTLYVPKVIATAVVASNLAAFGFGDLAVDAPVPTEEVDAPPGVSLAQLAPAAGVGTKELQALNPELRTGRTPPAAAADDKRAGDSTYTVKVPAGRGAAVAQSLAKARREPPFERYVVRFGETLDQIAAARRTTAQKLVELNAITPGEAIRGGTLLLVPRVEAPPASAAAPPQGVAAPAPKTTVVVPADIFVYPDRRRVFYRVQIGDTLREIAGALHVGVDDLDRWNDLDPGARLQEGMTLQAFVPASADLSGVSVVAESDVVVLPVGSDEFFAALERDKGFKRVTVVAKEGDTLEAIGRRYGVTARTMERVNRRARGATLKPGDAVVVYAPTTGPHAASPALLGAGATAANAPSGGPGGLERPDALPTPNGPLPDAPLPDLLP
jgi:membrane-bound lytic murein transglycosylase D